MEIFIDAVSAISPVGSFETRPVRLLPPDKTKGYFSCQEPDYKNTIDKKYLRRMSKFIKMSVAGALNCLSEAGIEQPDAILTGTSLGCVEDTIDFLQQINENAESMLNPTAFMQSTHNTASGQIALLLNCKNPNLTFSQKNISFESALLHAEMMLANENNRHILVGGMDEITPDSYELLKETNCFRSPDADNQNIPGEGVAFFVVSNQPSEKNQIRFNGITFCNSQAPEQGFKKSLQLLLDRSNLKADEIDLLLTGSRNSDDIHTFFSSTFGLDRMIHFKDFCGEYDTSTAFALWLALGMMDKSIVDSDARVAGKILIHNQGSGPMHSFILLSK